MISKSVLSIVLALVAMCFSSANAQNSIPLTVVLVGGEQIELSLEDLDSLEQVSFSTSTIWTDGVRKFSGVPVSGLLGNLNAEGSLLKLFALNDYSIEMPVAELESEVPIIATRIDGATISVREKGPYWIMFPFDDSPDYQTETIFARSIWQLQRIVLHE
ncbi:oxidoreductase [Ruegeria sp. HKCCD7318]|uniref:oxidoreductase n=1 Tax=Ruegeria sp. HKCCD7318 TaxID=2683014 RepID=UPI001490B8C1|nr:oxidoreductase [Ruegeria sp. HKCCD7318]NOE34495.1 oxidoreductase [Ruegeria sp. HKCCD7318]